MATKVQVEMTFCPEEQYDPNVSFGFRPKEDIKAGQTVLFELRTSELVKALKSVGYVVLKGEVVR